MAEFPFESLVALQTECRRWLSQTSFFHPQRTSVSALAEAAESALRLLVHFPPGGLSTAEFLEPYRSSLISTADGINRLGSNFANLGEFSSVVDAGLRTITSLVEALRPFDIALGDPDLGWQDSDTGRLDVPRTAIPKEIPTSQVDDRPAAKVISTGLSAVEDASSPLESSHSIPIDTTFYFWFEVGQKKVEGAIGDDTVYLASDLADGDEIEVALFSMPGGFDVPSTYGHMRLGRLSGAVLSQPSEHPVTGEIAERRLFFRIRTPLLPGKHAFRCNVYHERLLLQSILIEAAVGERGAPDTEAGVVGKTAPVSAVEMKLDYVLSRSLRSDLLPRLGAHRLSVLSNENGGTHAFRFYGGGDARGSVFMDTAAIQDVLRQARNAYRRVSWDPPGPFNPASPPSYRYNTAGSFAQLEKDLSELARTGHALWFSIAGQLAPNEDGARQSREALRRCMLAPGGRIQLALKQTARYTLPLALFYDHPFDDQLAEPTLCPTFVRQLGEDALATECFDRNGRGCPHYADQTIVCPSGFWGFRHTIGTPLSIRGTKEDVSTHIANDVARFRALAWAEPDLKMRSSHLDHMEDLYPTDYRCALSRNEGLKMLETDRPDLVYFYCHGDVDRDGNPLLRVGNRSDPAIAVTNFAEIAWETQPLVFINGCHTADVEPERAIQFVDELVTNVGASGVIGTEITVFEPLAVTFAQHFFKHLNTRRDVGEAMQRTRLELLSRELNPLGLLYVAYAMPSLVLYEVTP